MSSSLTEGEKGGNREKVWTGLEERKSAVEKKKEGSRGAIPCST